MIRALILCALLAGVGGAETQVVISTDVYHAWQETNKRIEKLENRVAELERREQDRTKQRHATDGKVFMTPVADQGISGFVPCGQDKDLLCVSK